jgi:hypothetical protein
MFERTVFAPPKLSTLLAELHPEAAIVFKGSYLVELPDSAREPNSRTSSDRCRERSALMKAEIWVERVQGRRGSILQAPSEQSSESATSDKTFASGSG